MIGDGASNYDGVGELLRHLLPNVPGSNITELLPPVEGELLDWEKYGELKEFDQNEFIDNPEGKYHGMQDNGFVFYPYPCVEDEAMCNLHVVLHGCTGGQRPNIIENGGRYWGKYAASNNFIVLFPFVDECWDTYAYTGDNYATNQGIQPKALMAMIDRVTSERNPIY
jgi:hypothetical protein